MTVKKKIKPSPDRLAVLEKIEEYERLGLFDKDVEDDPPGRMLRPEDVKYLDARFVSRLKRGFSFGVARLFFYRLLRQKKLYLNPAVGVEHLAELDGGAVITCNHFHPFDSFIMQKVFDQSCRRGKMYRVIREGNYTSFPGFYGMLMRNCDTLPLSSDPATMKLFLKAVHKSLEEKNCVLIYAEQSLWWNYRKPKPLKSSAFEIAVRRGVPVVPCFITFLDTDTMGDDGFPVLAYTPHVGAPIYPDATLNRREAAEKMRVENERFCREVYERVYGCPLVYTTQKEA
ncbi:MAG: 1-acyl-sn-glycerol-3-phosphate acyltransferase [Ruminococcaceae bacterium]|nr:1-acyl-sn-glycerol-3-phosphate acyltransferase [Oscillospiraceae bacterium]